MQNTYGLGKLAWRVIWVTIGFYAVAIVALSIQGSDLAVVSLHADTPGLTIFLLTMILLAYWPIFLLIWWTSVFKSSQRDFTLEDARRHKWRVWGAWVVITASITWSAAEWPDDWPFVVFWYVIQVGPVWLPPIGAVIGAIASDLLFRLYRMQVNK